MTGTLILISMISHLEVHNIHWSLIIQNSIITSKSTPFPLVLMNPMKFNTPPLVPSWNYSTENHSSLNWTIHINPFITIKIHTPWKSSSLSEHFSLKTMNKTTSKFTSAWRINSQIKKIAITKFPILPPTWLYRILLRTLLFILGWIVLGTMNTPSWLEEWLVSQKYKITLCSRYPSHHLNNTSHLIYIS